MPGLRKPGMDQEHYNWSPISTRPLLKWPDGARVALCIIINLEHFEWTIPPDGFMPRGPQGPQQLPHSPSTPWSHHEYGHRVGLFNVMEVLDKYGIKATVAMDAATADNYPFIVQECKKRDYEFIGHGLTMQRLITSTMNEEQEREYIRTSLSSLQKATGTRPVGWFGVEYSESARTPELLAEEGMRYVCDWPNDEQPYKMKTKNAYFLPVMLELDDEHTMRAPRFVPVTEYCQMLQDGFDILYRDGAQSGRVLALSLHPYLIGQPFRVKYLDKALEHITRYGALWKATGKEIIDWYAKQK